MNYTPAVSVFRCKVVVRVVCRRPKVHLQCSLFVVHCYPLHHDVNPSPKLVDRKNPLFQLPAVHVVEVVVCLFFIK